MSMMGTMMPRRLITPLMKSGALGIFVTAIVAANLLHLEDIDAVFLAAQGEGEIFLRVGHVRSNRRVRHGAQMVPDLRL